MSKTPEELAEEYANKHECGDQAWGGAYGGFLAGYKAATPQWISVKDRLPKIGEWVLINGSQICQRVASPSSNWDWEFAWATDHQTFYEPTDITHWMPLPKPPTE